MIASLPFLLVLSILLGLFHILLAGALVTASRGLGWNMGNRDGEPLPVPLHAARAQRAARNYLETFPFFAAAVVAALAMSRHGYLAQTGALIYVCARLVYLPVYVVGIPVIRSLVWVVAMAGLLMVVAALL